MTKQEFIEFEKLVRTNHVFWMNQEQNAEVYRIELFENGKFGTWVDIKADSCGGSMSLEHLKLSDFKVLAPIHFDLTEDGIFLSFREKIR